MKTNWVEHVAVRVKDLEWHLAFFRDALGMGVTEVQGADDAPDQVWVGGIQLTRDGSYTPRSHTQERVWHIGINVPDIDTALRRVRSYGEVSPFNDNPEQESWFVLPDGLVIELVSK